MILNSDLPSYATVARLDTVPGTRFGGMPLQQHMRDVKQCIENWWLTGPSRHGFVIVDAATGSGKSVLLPSEIQKHITGKLLALNPSTIDTKNVLPAMI